MWICSYFLLLVCSFFSIYLLHLFCLLYNEVFPFENENIKWILFSCIIHIYAEVCRLCTLEQQNNSHWIRSVLLSLWILLENVFVYCICICILLEAILLFINQNKNLFYSTLCKVFHKYAKKSIISEWNKYSISSFILLSSDFSLFLIIC